MSGILARLNDIRITLRLVVAIVCTLVVMWVAFLAWANYQQRNLAIDQARNFATSLHQMTLAGLTGMMITGTVAQRSVFLDQIRESNDVEKLKVLRAEAVIKQFGRGMSGELPEDEAERQVLVSGEPYFQIVSDGKGAGGERLRAILPVIAAENYLGKNCMGCHLVPPGSVLGAVSMEISLARVDASVRDFNRGALWVVALLLPVLAFVIWYFVVRIVTRPLGQMTDGLQRIADGNIEESPPLPRQGDDEIGRATQAFNRVMTKAGELLGAQRLSHIVFENALEGIIVSDENNRIQMVNRAFMETTGYSLAEVIGSTPAILKSGKHSDDFYKEFWQTLRDKDEWSGEIWNKRKNGTVYPEWMSVKAIRNGHGHIEHYVAIFNDITERKQREELITYQAFHDALTGLPNRSLFKDRLDLTLAAARRHKNRSLAVMFLDLDRFKEINDVFGHDAGDELLKEVATRLRRCVRESDTVARMGGDEFTILLPEISAQEDARNVGQKILDSMRQPVTLAGEKMVVTTSIGVSTYPKDGRDHDTLMKHADVAMYHVKQTGRAGLAFFSPALLGKPSRRQELETRLGQALANNEFVLHYQPMLDLVSGRPFGVEALLRWKEHDGSLMLPEEFLGIAEEIGLMGEIGRWVLAEACQQAARWRAAGFDLCMAINLSARQFHRQDFVADVAAALAASGLASDALQLEISEALVVRDLGATLSILSQLHEQGLRIAIDDYGSGHFNFSELRQLPLDYVKLDRALMLNALDDEAHKSIALALVKSAQILELPLIAEGIEKPAQLDFLRAINCRMAQGFLFCRPGPAAEIETYLHARLSV